MRDVLLVGQPLTTSGVARPGSLGKRGGEEGDEQSSPLTSEDRPDARFQEAAEPVQLPGEDRPCKHRVRPTGAQARPVGNLLHDLQEVAALVGREQDGGRPHDRLDDGVQVGPVRRLLPELLHDREVPLDDGPQQALARAEVVADGGVVRLPGVAHDVGEPGPGPGQFSLPHGVWIDGHGRVLVCDRENDRVQVFDQAGRLLRVWPTKLIGPAVFYVDAHDIVYIPEHNGGLLSVLTLEGERLAQWGDPSFRSCHGIWGDSRGDLYVVRPGAWGRQRRVVKHVRVG